MRATLALLVPGLLVLATGAGASGVNLAWDQCLPEGGMQAKHFACGQNSGYDEIVGSFVPGQAHAAFIGCEVAVDIQSENPVLPDWWQFFNTGSCRQNALTTTFDFTTAPQSACNDPFQGQAMGGLAAYLTSRTQRPVPGGKANAARIILAMAMAVPTRLASGVEYYCFRLRISNQASAGAGSCAGCTTPACITLAEVAVYDDNPPAPGGQETPPRMAESLTTQHQSNGIGWQDTGQNCTSAVKNKTWGQLKNIYR